jgi:hypothetical protein
LLNPATGYGTIATAVESFGGPTERTSFAGRNEASGPPLPRLTLPEVLAVVHRDRSFRCIGGVEQPRVDTEPSRRTFGA